MPVQKERSGSFVPADGYELTATVVGKPVYVPPRAFQHLVSRHVLGRDLDKKTKTTLYPVGQEVMGRRIPMRMRVDEIVYFIDEAVRSGKPRPKGDTVVIIYETENPEESGINRLKVVLKEVKGDFGVHFEVLTAYPLEGPCVTAYENGKWVK